MVEHANHPSRLLPTAAAAAAPPGLKTGALSCAQTQQVRGVEVSSNRWQPTLSPPEEPKRDPRVPMT